VEEIVASPSQAIDHRPMVDTQIAAYASAIRKLLDACGRAPRDRVLAALRAFGLAEEEARTVVVRGLALGLYIEDSSNAHLLPPQQARREAYAVLGDQIIDPQKEPSIARRLAVLRVLLSTLPVVMWAVDRDGHFIYHEGKGLESLGLDEGTLVGQKFHEIFADHVAIPYIARIFEGELVRVYWEYGGRGWEHWGFPIKNAAGEVELAALIALDVTDARQTERDLRAQLEMIERQQRVITELSTPIIEVWEKTLVLPLLGVVDSTRAAAVMTSLLSAVVSKGARFVLLDVTGVDAVDTATASHMLEIIRAVRLLGAEGIITGIRPSVAQTMITLEVDLKGIVTHANLRQGLQDCLRASRQ
jgi:rsbT co-antagonist protein RsbR